MNLGQMRTKLRRRIGNPVDPNVTDDLLNEMINQGYRDVADRFRFHKNRKLCTFLTVAGQSNYGLPTELLSIIKMRDMSNGGRIMKSDARQDSEREVDTTDNEGKPKHYTRYKSWVMLRPTPDDEYTIEVFYKADIVDLVSDVEEPILPVVWHYGIVEMAKYYYYMDQPDLPKAQAAMAAFNDWVSSKPTEVDEEKMDFDTGVAVPTLTQGGSDSRLDFNHSE